MPARPPEAVARPSSEAERLEAVLTRLVAELDAGPEVDLRKELPPGLPEAVVRVYAHGALFAEPLSPSRGERLLLPTELEVPLDGGVMPLIEGVPSMETGALPQYCVRLEQPWGPLVVRDDPDTEGQAGPPLIAWFEQVLEERRTRAPPAPPPQLDLRATTWARLDALPASLSGKAYVIIPAKKNRMLSLLFEVEPGVWLRGQALWTPTTESWAIEQASEHATRTGRTQQRALWAETDAAVRGSLSAALSRQGVVLQASPADAGVR